MAETVFTLASLDMTSLSEDGGGFQPALQSLAEELAAIEPDAVCVRGATSTAVLRAINGYLVRRRNKLMRMSCTIERPASGEKRYLAIIYRQTNRVAVATERHGERIGLAVNVIEPRVLVVAARAALDELPPEGVATLVCAPSGAAPTSLAEGYETLPGDDGADVMIGRGVTAGEHGVRTSEGATPVAVTWQRVTVG